MSRAPSIRSAPPFAWLERAAKDRGKAEAPRAESEPLARLPCGGPQRAYTLGAGEGRRLLSGILASETRASPA